MTPKTHTRTQTLSFSLSFSWGRVSKPPIDGINITWGLVGLGQWGSLQSIQSIQLFQHWLTLSHHPTFSVVHNFLTHSPLHTVSPLKYNISHVNENKVSWEARLCACARLMCAVSVLTCMFFQTDCPGNSNLSMYLYYSITGEGGCLHSQPSSAQPSSTLLPSQPHTLLRLIIHSVHWEGGGVRHREKGVREGDEGEP